MVEPQMLYGVDMTPIGYEWRCIDHVWLYQFLNQPLFDLHVLIEQLIEKYGHDTKFHHQTGSSTFLVMKNLPVYSEEQLLAKRRAEDEEARIRVNEDAS
jgi:hypothetical protein